MGPLSDTYVWRKPNTGSNRKWVEGAAVVAVGVFSQYASEERMVTLSFSIPCSGGRTDIQVEIGPKDYARILEAMSAADRAAALAEMSATLAKMLRVSD